MALTPDEIDGLRELILLFTAPSRRSCCATCAGALPPPDRYRPAMNTSFCWQKALRARMM